MLGSSRWVSSLSHDTGRGLSMSLRKKSSINQCGGNIGGGCINVCHKYIIIVELWLIFFVEMNRSSKAF